MKAYLIIFEGQDYIEIIKRIKNTGYWAKIADNSFIVLSDSSSSDIRTNLYQNIRVNKIYVVNITNCGWSSYGLSKEVTDWLKSNLKQ